MVSRSTRLGGKTKNKGLDGVNEQRAERSAPKQRALCVTQGAISGL